MIQIDLISRKQESNNILSIFRELSATIPFTGQKFHEMTPSQRYQHILNHSYKNTRAKDNNREWRLWGDYQILETIRDEEKFLSNSSNLRQYNMLAQLLKINEAYQSAALVTKIKNIAINQISHSNYNKATVTTNSHSHERVATNQMIEINGINTNHNHNKDSNINNNLTKTNHNTNPINGNDSDEQMNQTVTYDRNKCKQMTMGLMGAALSKTRLSSKQIIAIIQKLYFGLCINRKSRIRPRSFLNIQRLNAYWNWEENCSHMEINQIPINPTDIDQYYWAMLPQMTNALIIMVRHAVGKKQFCNKNNVKVINVPNFKQTDQSYPKQLIKQQSTLKKQGSSSKDQQSPSKSQYISPRKHRISRISLNSWRILIKWLVTFQNYITQAIIRQVETSIINPI